MEGPTADTCEKGGRMSNTKLPPPRSSTTVLLIDSFQDDRQYWAERLHISSPNYVILEADTGAAGLALCQSQRVDCVVLELNLPDMPGLEVLIKLVPRILQPETAVIVLSRVSYLAIGQLAKDNGAQAFLFKSHASGDQLSMAIQNAIATVGLTKEAQV
jgi:DNA-binding NarL/FixJ family response regulator